MSDIFQMVFLSFLSCSSAYFGDFSNFPAIKPILEKVKTIVCIFYWSNFLLAPLQRSWQAVGLTEEFRANDVRPYGIPLSPMVTSPFSRGTRDSSALTGTSSMRGGFRANDVRPYDIWLQRVIVAMCHHRVPENKNPPEGGTGCCCRRKKNRFSPLDRGVRLSGEHAAKRR